MNNLFIIMLLVVSLGLVSLVSKAHSQNELDFKIMKGEVVTVNPGEGKPDTITVKTKGKYAWEKEQEVGITIDPANCKFYKDDKQPKTIDIVKPGDMLEITYVVSEGVMVAFNVVVLPKSEAGAVKE